jgi:diguanylate cyclase (GGDEF)-like protein/PAS domain S-box-containing protein
MSAAPETTADAALQEESLPVDETARLAALHRAKSDGVLQYAMEREKLFRDTFEQAPIGIMHTSPHGLILRVNQRACALLGYGSAELRELSIPSITHPEDLTHNIREFKRTLAGEIESYRLEQRLLAKDQRYVRVTLSVTIRRDASRQADYNIVTIDAISDAPAAALEAREKAVGEKQAALEALEKLLAKAQAALKAREKSVSEAQAARKGREKSVSEAQASLKEREKSLLDARSALKTRDKALAEAQQTARAAEDGLRFAQEELRGVRLTLRDTQGALRDAQDQQREAQAALQAANAKLAHESSNDALTALPNRRTFSRRGEQAAITLRQSRKLYGLILLNVDNFKHVNEEYGHDVGDDVLRTLGNILSTQLRNSSDMAARLGGDEFAVLCFGDVNEQTLHDVAERIHGQIGKAPLATPKGLLRFTGSFGLALSIADDSDWKSVYGRADAALREAKHAGKDRISFGRSPMKNVTARLRALSQPPAG